MSTQFTQEEFAELADQLRTTARGLLPEIIDRKLPLMLVALENMVVPQVTVDAWQPIESAPNDGSFIIGRRSVDNEHWLICVVSWRFWRLGDDVLADLQPTFRWRDANGRHFTPTEWMPIPE